MSDDSERVWLAAVGMRIRLARIACGRSQDRLGEEVGVSRVTVGSIERGDHPAAVTAYVQLARTLGPSLDELLAGTP